MTSRLVVNSVRHTGASADAITMDASGNVTFPGNATCSGTPSGFGGITMHDNWYVGAGLDPGGGTNVITANWTRDTRTETGSIGSAMTESSGLFTFPSTGIYHLHIEGGFYRNNTSDHKYVGFTIQTTTNNGGGYATANSAYQALKGQGANTYIQTACEYTFDVTDVSQCKVRFATESDGSGTSAVDIGGRRFTLTFTRLGDT